MSNETKRDVFGQLLNAYQNLISKDIEMHDENYRENVTTPWNIVYDAALPDDLPVVSKDVSDAMRTYHFLWWKGFLDKAYDNELSSDGDINYKVRSESAEVALAWLLGVWRVEETGEIVKLEAEK